MVENKGRRDEKRKNTRYKDYMLTHENGMKSAGNYNK